jgi:hypothetical protein
MAYKHIGCKSALEKDLLVLSLVLGPFLANLQVFLEPLEAVDVDWHGDVVEVERHDESWNSSSVSMGFCCTQGRSTIEGDQAAYYKSSQCGPCLSSSTQIIMDALEP